jgi:hypothetical protein
MIGSDRTGFGPSVKSGFKQVGQSVMLMMLLAIPSNLNSYSNNYVNRTMPPH